jgi:hypothetical protein
MDEKEYLTVKETAAFLDVSEKRVRNMMSPRSGVFREDQHFFRPQSLDPRFKLSALRDYIEAKDRPAEAPRNLVALGKGLARDDRETLRPLCAQRRRGADSKDPRNRDENRDGTRKQARRGQRSKRKAFRF